MEYKVGMKVKCKIKDNIIDDAKIQIVYNEIFICQNVISGMWTPNKLGYLYSWCIFSGNERELEETEVYDLKVLSYQSQYQKLKLEGII